MLLGVSEAEHFVTHPSYCYINNRISVARVVVSRLKSRFCVKGVFYIIAKGTYLGAISQLAQTV